MGLTRRGGLTFCEFAEALPWGGVEKQDPRGSLFLQSDTPRIGRSDVQRSASVAYMEFAEFDLAIRVERGKAQVQAAMLELSVIDIRADARDGHECQRFESP
jgi:hypothetical protein